MTDTIALIVKRIEDSAAYESMDPELKEDVKIFLDALKVGRFFFEQEAWHGPCDNLPSEMLLRIYDDDEKKINFGAPMQVINNYGFGYDLFSFLVAASLKRAEEFDLFPVSINIPPYLAVSRKFWEKLAPDLEQYNPNDVIFEILEPDIPKYGDLSILREMRTKGYRFALDDVEDNADLERRLKYFGPFLDFVKIDGKEVKKEFAGKRNLGGLLGKVRKVVPDIMVIAEWVEDSNQAHHLHDCFNIEAVQGRALKDDDMKASYDERNDNIPPYNRFGALFIPFQP